MATSSTKPYLTRALWEWCNDNGLTPLIQVQVEGGQARVPMEFVKDGQIVLNVGPAATRNLTMNNVEIKFSARFGGVSREISVPWNAVKGLYARETGEGMLFPPEEIETEDVEGFKDSQEAVESGSDAEADPQQKQKKPTLTVVK